MTIYVLCKSNTINKYAHTLSSFYFTDKYDLFKEFFFEKYIRISIIRIHIF